ncbi:MAG: NAD(P)H-hydrate dehydratase [Rhodobacteraceae bacterium]|nr:NAD(P)H-hydrate dehydratase [Paracoccaceae bacterium]
MTALSPDQVARLAKRVDQHKYDHGHALILAGGPGRGGAARLAARAALRVGAGLVTVACPPAAMAENAAQLNAVMLRPLADAADLTRILDDRRFNGLCLGPGLGLGEATRDLVRAALAAERALVLDADALTAHAAAPGELFDRLHPRSVLTPHSGEFARLFPDLGAGIGADFGESGLDARRRAVLAAAERAGATVLLKGAVTLIAEPGGGAASLDLTGALAAPWLATAGSGDVLAGIITGLLARGVPPFQAAELGAWMHAAAGRQAGAGLIAEDLPDALPAVFRGLGL